MTTNTTNTLHSHKTRKVPVVKKHLMTILTRPNAGRTRSLSSSANLLDTSQLKYTLRLFLQAQKKNENNVLATNFKIKHDFIPVPISNQTTDIISNSSMVEKLFKNSTDRHFLYQFRDLRITGWTPQCPQTALIEFKQRLVYDCGWITTRSENSSRTEN